MAFVRSQLGALVRKMALGVLLLHLVTFAGYSVLSVRGDLAAQFAEDPDLVLPAAPPPPPGQLPSFGPPPPLAVGQLTNPQEFALGDLQQARPFDFALRRIVKFWHDAAVEAHRLDYSRTERNGENDFTVVPPKVEGPCCTSRALATVHLAIYDAFVGISGDGGTYLPYSGASQLLPRVPLVYQPIAIWLAVSRAAYETITAFYPSAQPPLQRSGATRTFDSGVAEAAGRNDAGAVASAEEVSRKSGTAETERRPGDDFVGFLKAISEGLRWGGVVSKAILAVREGDVGGEICNDSTKLFTDVPPPNDSYWHQADPTIVDPDTGERTQKNYAKGYGKTQAFGFAGELTPNVLDLLPDPRSDEILAEYVTDFATVKRIGRLNASEDERPFYDDVTGIFWAYDGALYVGLPNRMFSQSIDAIIAEAQSSQGKVLTGYGLVRVYAIVFAAMADGAIAAWRDKYEWNFWRPVVGIREDNVTAGVTKEAGWKPLGSPQTNLPDAADRTRSPPFPAYPSGHATIGEAAYTALMAELDLPPTFRYEFTSSEFDGVALEPGHAVTLPHDVPGDKRPVETRPMTIGQAIEENKVARTLLGVHWDIDSKYGGVLGKQVGERIAAAFPARA